MALKHSWAVVALLAVGIADCTVTTGSSNNCSPDSMVSCTGTSIGYSCKGGETPALTNAFLNCSMGVAGTAGATWYCCATLSAPAPEAGAGCSPIVGPSGCPSNLTEYSCPGSAAPGQTIPSLTCGPGIAGMAGASLYCCGTMGAGPASGVPDAGTVDAGSSDVAALPAPSTEAGAADVGVSDAGACAVAAKTSGAACDQCIGSLCCAQLVACDAPDNAGVDDAGMSACEQLLGCISDCIAGNPDAGVPPGTRSDCQMVCGPSYTSTEQQNASALLDCITSNCSTSCL